MGVFDQNGNRFIRENIGSDNKPSQIVFIPSSTDGNDKTLPTEFNAIGIMSDGANNPRLNPANSFVFNLGTKAEGYFQYDFNQPINLFNQGFITGFKEISAALYGFPFLAGSPDIRVGVTAADASPITIFSSTASGVRYEVKARILATAGSSATYKIVWTEGGVAQSISLTITAVDTEVHDNFVIAPDAGTDITAQITSLTSSTVNVDAIVSVLG